MKTPIVKELVSDLEAVLKRYGVEDLYYPHVLGQALDHLKEQCLTNSVPWMLGGILSSYAIRTNAISIVKKLVELLTPRGNKPLNYNDLDCDLWGKYIKIPVACLDCDSFFAKMMANKEVKTKNCVRCKGTAIDPDFFDHAWVLYFSDHGNSAVFIVQENAISYKLHIRALPSNMNKQKALSFFNKFVKAAQKERYASDFEYMRYLDSRDTGFVLSLDYAKDDLRVNDCEGTLRASHQLSTIVEHFPCVIDSFDTLVKEDTINPTKATKC